MKRFLVQHTGRPYGPCESMDGAAWFTFSTHATLSAAKKRRDAEIAEMRRACGQGAWSDHFRISVSADTPMRRWYECICGRRESQSYVWHAGEPYDQEPDSCELLPGWNNQYECSACGAGY